MQGVRSIPRWDLYQAYATHTQSTMRSAIILESVRTRHLAAAAASRPKPAIAVGAGSSTTVLALGEHSMWRITSMVRAKHARSLLHRRDHQPMKVLLSCDCILCRKYLWARACTMYCAPSSAHRRTTALRSVCPSCRGAGPEHDSGGPVIDSAQDTRLATTCFCV